jgi:hypothetical protein
MSKVIDRDFASRRRLNMTDASKRCHFSAIIPVRAAAFLPLSMKGGGGMAVRNDIRLAAAGPIDGVTKFPQWFEDHRGVRLELVARPDPMAPAIGDIPEPGSPVVHPTNFPEESFYFMAEARLQVAGNGTIGRARVIMALEAAFGGDEEPETSTGGPNPGVVFARLRVRMEDVVPGETYVVRHPYGETRPLIADERGRVAYTCDLGVSENDLTRVLVSGEIAPFLAWTAPLPNGYIGDGVTEHAVPMPSGSIWCPRPCSPCRAVSRGRARPCRRRRLADRAFRCSTFSTRNIVPPAGSCGCAGRCCRSRSATGRAVTPPTAST